MKNRERPFEKTPTEKLKLAIGVGKAGLTMWSKTDTRYAECERRIAQMKTELDLRGKQ